MVTTKHAPILPSATMRQDYWYMGLPDELRAQQNALAVSQGTMSVEEYKEMFENGSYAYRIAANKAMKEIVAIWNLNGNEAQQ